MSKQYWLGIAKLKNVFRLTIIPSTRMIWNFKNFLFNRIFHWLTNRLTDWLTDRPTDRLTDRPTDWLTDWLTDLLLPLDKQNLIMAMVTGLIFHWSMLLNPETCFLPIAVAHHGSTKAYLCSPFLSPLQHQWWFAVCTLWP